jgi:hypothetical protein
MQTMTRNSTISQAVLWTGCLISLVGLFTEPSKTMFVVGLTLVSSGMIQSYYGTVLEIEGRERTWYFALGVLLAIAMAYSAYLSLRDYAPKWQWMLAVVVATLCLQFVISMIGLKLWSFRHRTTGKQ